MDRDMVVSCVVFSGKTPCFIVSPAVKMSCDVPSGISDISFLLTSLAWRGHLDMHEWLLVFHKINLTQTHSSKWLRETFKCTHMPINDRRLSLSLDLVHITPQGTSGRFPGFPGVCIVPTGRDTDLFVILIFDQLSGLFMHSKYYLFQESKPPHYDYDYIVPNI